VKPPGLKLKSPSKAARRKARKNWAKEKAPNLWEKKRPTKLKGNGPKELKCSKSQLNGVPAMKNAMYGKWGQKKFSSMEDNRDRTTGILFGDGPGACVNLLLKIGVKLYRCECQC